MPSAKYDTGAQRIVAAIIDWLILASFLWLLSEITKDVTRAKEGLIWQQFFAYIPLLYYIFFHHYYGRTIGKAFMGIKVLDVSEKKRLSILQAIRRDIVYVVLQITVTISTFVMLSDDTNEIIYESSATVQQLFDWSILTWTIAEFITMLFNNKRRAIHDFIAASVVIRT